VFFDDILIFNSSWAKHLQNVRVVLNKLREHHLFKNKSKYVIGWNEVAYLGHVISAIRVAMDDQKVRAVVDWLVPRSVRTVCAFLVLVGYYHRFIKDYDTIATPVTGLLCKDSFRWSAEVAFCMLQGALT
jgi:hypothetical protein